MHRNSWIDHVARLFALLGSSLPVFWTGLFLLYVFYARLGWFPGPGRLDPRAAAPDKVTGMYTVDSLLAGDLATFGDALQHIALPSFVLGWAVMGIISRLVRASLLEVLNQDYVRTVRAKGLAERRVIIAHALRNALIPTLTIIGISVVQSSSPARCSQRESSRGPESAPMWWNRRGRSSSRRSWASPILGGVIFLLANLVTDMTYVLVDPRIRLS